MSGIFNAAIFNNAVFNTAVEVGSPKPWKQKWRQELAELLAEPQPEVKIPAKAKKAIQRVLEKAPADDSAAIRSLRNELDRLRTPYRQEYATALRIEALRAFEEPYNEEEDIILLMLH